MGNKLANPEEITDEDIANYRSSTPVKKEHVLRLWVDLFNVKEDDSHEADLQWHKTTEDVVPASITCISGDHNTIYHIKAYNSQVEKICDVQIVQPGTKLKQPTPSFIHFKDAVTEKHWGFNFTCADDAAKFRDTCLTLSAPTISKSSSFGTLRLPKKKWKTGSGRDGGAKRSGTLDGLSSLSSGSNQRLYGGRDIEGILTAPSLEVVSTMSLDRRLLRHKKQTQGFRQNPTTRVDSRQLFASQLPAEPILESPPTPQIPAPQSLALISEQDDSDEHIANNDLPQDSGTPPQSSIDSVDLTALPNEENFEMPKPSRLDLVARDTANSTNESTPEESSSEESSSMESSEEYNKPAALSAAHLNAILFSCENIASSTEKEQHPTATQQDVISEEEEEVDTTIVEDPTVTSILLSTTDSEADDGHAEAVSADSAPISNSLSEKSNSHVIFSSISNDLNFNNDSTLHKMLQSLPSTSASNASFGIEAELGDPSITAPLPNTDSSKSLLRRASNRGQSATSIFRGSHRSKRSDDCQSLSSSNDKMIIEYEQKLREQDMYDENKKEYDDHNASLYQDSGFGGTVSTNKSASVKSSKSKTSRQSSRISSSGKSQSSLVTGSESVYSSSSSQNTKTSDITQVKPFTTFSDQSENECDEEDNSSTNSFTTQPAVVKSYSSLARQSGATRKTGWLEVKNWLMHSKKKLAFANKRHWKRYWVTLRGTTLMFYSCDDQASLTEDALPKHVIYVDCSIAQSVPEHPKRENIFSVSSYGDAYLFQAPTQFEHDNWITSIHSACASQHARQHGKTNPLKVLQSEIEKLQENIDSDSKMKKMAELQLSVVKEIKSRSAISKQIRKWEENLECLFMDQYRFKCYLSSLQGSELPNPKYILASMSRSTKQRLGKLGILNVTSFHSLICVRTPNAFNTYIGQQQQKKGLLSTLRQNSSQSRLRVTADTFVPPAPGSDDGDALSGNDDSEESGTTADVNNTEDLSNSLGSKFGDNLTRILLPNQQLTVVQTDEEMSVRDVLEVVCNKRQLVFSDCFLRIRTKYSTDYVIPQLEDIFETLIVEAKQKDYDRVEVCNKIIFQVDMERSGDEMFGLEVEAELADDAETEDELKVFIEEVEVDGPAERAGVIAGDELLTLNGKVVLELDIEHIDNILANELQVCMTVRSCRLKRPDCTIASALTNHADTYIDNMMCPPPPLQSRISNRIIDDLIVPAPTWVHNLPEKDGDEEETPLTPRAETEKSVTDIKDLLVTAEQVTHLCRMAHERKVQDADPIIIPIFQPLTEAQKLRKIIMELIHTERSYVRDLSMLMERYLEPLKEETFLSSEEVVRLVGNIQEIVHFQREFLKNLEESIDDESFVLYTAAYEFKKVLFSIAGSFIYYANHFKLYSSFCASHSRAQKVLSPGDNSELYEFLHARNPKQQHSATLESYLIKPIQRILKYPLLLNQMKGLTDPDSNEFTHLSDALQSMESVAEHINEMQKIYEEFGSVFDDLTRVHAHKQSNHGADKRKLELNVGDLQYYGEADWLNAYDDISKPRKGWEHVSTMFVFKHGIVILCQEKPKGKSSKNKGNFSRFTIENMDTVYCKFLPVSEIQVRTLPTTHAGGPVALWELLHLKSATESRPEKIYHMACSNVNKRIEFLKYMRLIIRESVKKMTVPKAKLTDAESRLRHSAIEQLRHSVLDSTRNSVTTDLQTDSSSTNRQPDNRYSMNLDCERLTIPDLDHQGGRSRTFGDLADLTDGDPLNIRNTSVNSVDSDTSHGSARLVYSSQDPIAYSSKGSLDYLDSGSPIWEKRSDDFSENLMLSSTSSNENVKRTLKIHELYVNTATEC